MNPSSKSISTPSDLNCCVLRSLVLFWVNVCSPKVAFLSVFAKVAHRLMGRRGPVYLLGNEGKVAYPQASHYGSVSSNLACCCLLNVLVL